MNVLFDIPFPQTKAEEESEGIWIGRKDVSHNHTLLLLDLPGIDSARLYANNRWAIEGNSALLAVSVSQMLIVNVAAKDILLEEGSNLPFLVNVFRAYYSVPPEALKT